MNNNYTEAGCRALKENTILTVFTILQLARVDYMDLYFFFNLLLFSSRHRI